MTANENTAIDQLPEPQRFIAARWREGAKASEISAELKVAGWDKSRSAVLGLVNRMRRRGIDLAERTTHPRGGERRAVNAAPAGPPPRREVRRAGPGHAVIAVVDAAPPRPLPAGPAKSIPLRDLPGLDPARLKDLRGDLPVPPDAAPVSLIEREAGRCAFPLWSDRVRRGIERMLFCGAPAIDGADYCGCHAEFRISRRRMEAS